MRKFIFWLMKQKSWRWLLMKIVPYVRFSMYYAKLRGWQYHQAYSVLKAGDILLSVDNKKLTSLLIPGVFTHASFCVSKDGIFEIAEMTHENFLKSCLFDIFKEADRVVILRADWSDDYRESSIARCRTLERCNYDVQFDLGVDSLYCSELVYQSDFRRTLDFDLSDLAGLGRKYLSPDGIYACKNLTVIFDSDLCTLE